MRIKSIKSPNLFQPNNKLHEELGQDSTIIVPFQGERERSRGEGRSRSHVDREDQRTDGEVKIIYKNPESQPQNCSFEVNIAFKSWDPNDFFLGSI